MIYRDQVHRPGKDLLQIGRWILGLPRRPAERPGVPTHSAPARTDPRQSALALIASGFAPITTKLSKPLFMNIIRRSSEIPNAMKILKLRFLLKMYTLYDGRRRGMDHGRT